jgi:hypothetical protein
VTAFAAALEPLWAGFPSGASLVPRGVSACSSFTFFPESVLVECHCVAIYLKQVNAV